MIVTPPSFEPLASAPDSPDAVTLVYRGGEILLREPDGALPEGADLDALREAAEPLEPVGRWNGRYFHATSVPKDHAPPPGLAFRGLRSLFGRLDDALVAIAGRGFQIADWARTHRFCGVCGQPMRRDAGERVMRCACGHSAWPRVAPAMM